jgi:hypothetical protein
MSFTLLLVFLSQTLILDEVEVDWILDPVHFAYVLALGVQPVVFVQVYVIIMILLYCFLALLTGLLCYLVVRNLL